MRVPYIIAEENPPEINKHAELFGLDRTLIKILHSRGCDTPEKIDLFINPRLSDLYSPFMMSDMYRAVVRVRSAIDSGERIGIFADSDIDGIAALAVLHGLLARMKINPHIRYLKNDETYGMTKEIVDEFHGQGVTLLVTVDSGIRDTAEITYARSLGIDVIVSDHHEQDAVLPDAIILNPKTEICTYPFKHLAGVGISFKLCHALLLSFLPSFNKLFLIITKVGDRYSFSAIRNCIIEEIQTEADVEQIARALRSAAEGDIVLFHNVSGLAEIVKSSSCRAQTYDFCGFIGGILKSNETDLEGICARLKIGGRRRPIDTLNAALLETQAAAPGRVYEFIRSVIGLVALGSIADVMPLLDENRTLVKIGIEELNRNRLPALSMLIGDERINYKTIGWKIAPMLNTPGRLGKTELTFNFFTESNAEKLQSIISEIGVLNDGRKGVIQKLVSKILSDFKSGARHAGDKIVYLKTDEVPDGYAGLIANRIADAVDKPVILVVLPGKNGVIKGSCRIKNEHDFFSHVRQFSSRFERIGGHEKAFGFTAKAADIDDIIRSIEESYLHTEEMPRSAVQIDSELDLRGIRVGFIKELEMLEPFGNGNAEPVFISRNIVPESYGPFGNNHGKYLFSHNANLSAVGWGMAAVMKELFEGGSPLDIIYQLENNEYNGRVRPRMILVDISLSEN